MTDVQTAAEPVGKRARRGLAMKNLIPSVDWINVNVVAKGKGTQVVIGRIVGMATSCDEKFNEHQGQQLRSLVLGGTFEAESFVTGEVIDASSAYFPMAYAEKVQALFLSDPLLKMVEIDADIGLEATGKPIPYEWVVIAYREGAEMAVLKRIRQSRGRPQNAFGGPTEAELPSPGNAAQLADHSGTPHDDNAADLAAKDKSKGKVK